MFKLDQIKGIFFICTTNHSIIHLSKIILGKGPPSTSVLCVFLCLTHLHRKRHLLDLIQTKTFLIVGRQ